MDPIEVLALTVLGEAGGRPVRAQEGVAAVVLNRVAAARRLDGPAHWGSDVPAACRAPFQFPCWNPNSATHQRLRAPDGAGLEAARRIAARAIRTPGRDPVHGATRYHDVAQLPAWAIGEVPVAEVGGLVFYRMDA